jgi:hypothetical protein
MDPRLAVALVITAVFHGGLLVFGSFTRTYDALIHLFFADHYARSWFSTWEPRWYTGFTTVSYPPGSHQLLALLSKLFGYEAAFVIVALAATLLLVVGVYRFSRLWVSQRAAGYAALLAALSSSIAQTLHVFGQLPTLLSLGLLLNSLPFAHRWFRTGHLPSLAAGLACAAATTAGHHVTTLFGSVFFLGPVAVLALVEQARSPLPDEQATHAVRFRRSLFVPLVVRRLRRVLPALWRVAVYGVLVIIALVTVVLPYWLWSSSDPIVQMPIPHASRDNFLADLNVGLVFWLVPWGLLALVLPFVVVRGLFGTTWPLAASVGLLALLGTGGTTPLPRMLLGGAFDILTLDRFTFWGTIAVLPLVGRFVESVVHGRGASWMSGNLGDRTTRGLRAVAVVGIVAFTVFAANLAVFRPMQPAPIDIDPIVAFIEKDDHDRWRYLTLGFGDQMAWLSAATTAETVDGNYHSARRLPELTTTPVERLEGAKYSGVPGLGSLQQFLAIPEKYHLKFVFSNDQFYDPLLAASGWQYLGPLENGIAVWQRDDVDPLPAGRERQELPLVQRLMWGLLPMFSIAAAALVLVSHGLGLGWIRSNPRPALPRWLTTPWRRVDRRLAAVADRIPDEGPAPRWQLWQRGAERFYDRLLHPVSDRRRRVQAAIVVLVGVLGLLVVADRAQSPDGPERVVERYYDALDWRRLDDAYAALDPATRPSKEQFLLERSVENGLVASYAKLDRITTEVIRLDADRAVTRSEIVFVTALTAYEVEVEHELRRTDGRWGLVAAPPDLRIPPDPVVSRAGVGWFGQGRRQVTTGTTAYADVVDRPEIRVLSASLVRHAGELSVVGEVRNDDVEPAYLTLTARLIDEDGEILSSYSTATAAAHTALPGEVVPFRIDFEGVAGLLPDEELGFDPSARTPLAVETERIATVEIDAKALVTTLDLDRSLGAVGVRQDDEAITGVVRNDGLDEVTVPQVMVTLRRPDGTVGWVDVVYLSDAVRPQRSQPFELRPATIDTVERIDVPIEVFANGQDSTLAASPPVLLGPIAGWAGADLSLFGFTRPT